MSREELEVLAAEVASDIGSKLDAEREDRRGPRDHSKSNWASEIGHPCKKFLVHARLDWTKKTPMDLDGGYRVEQGNREEWWTEKDLGDIGYKIKGTQEYFFVDEVQIGGKIDGRLPLPIPIESFPEKRAVSIEIKSINPRYWDGIRVVADMAEHRAWWIRGYPSQLNAALYHFKDPFGFFVLTTYGKRPKILPMLFDAEGLEADFSKLRDVNAHVKARTYPNPIPYDPQVCGMCDFSHLCQPPRATEMIEIPSSEIPILRQYIDLQEWDERFKKARAALIGNAEKPGRYYGANAIIEDIEISTSRQKRRIVKDLPDDLKARIRELEEPFAEKREILITSIERIIPG